MKPRIISEPPIARDFGPLDTGERSDRLNMTTDELEAIRLVDYEGLMQEEAAFRMGVSRGTVWRCLANGRAKLAIMVVEARRLSITDEVPDLATPTSSSGSPGGTGPEARGNTQSERSIDEDRSGN